MGVRHSERNVEKYLCNELQELIIICIFAAEYTIMRNLVKIPIVVVLAAVTITVSSAQERMPAGQWRTHQSYNGVLQLVECRGIVWGVADGALLSVDGEDGSVRTYSTLTGLSANDVHRIFRIDDRILVSYEDATIDVIDAYGEVENAGDLRDKNMNGSKTVEGVVVDRGTAYLACGFGIATLRLSKMEFGDTYVFGNGGEVAAVKNIAIDGKTLYALTDTMLLAAEIGNANLMNYRNWNNIEIPDGRNQDMVMREGVIYILKSDSSVWSNAGGAWSRCDERVTDIWADDHCMYTRYHDGRVKSAGRYSSDALEDNPLSAVSDGVSVWTSSGLGVVRTMLANGEKRSYMVCGPATNFVWKLKCRNGKVMTVPGGRFADNYFRDAFVSWFEYGTWRFLRGDYMWESFPMHRVYDWVDVEIDPKDNNHFWVAGYGVGLVEFRENALCKVHTFNNSGIETLLPDGDDYSKYNYMRIDGLTYDCDGRLWLLNRGTAQVKYVDTDGSWHWLPYSGLSSANTLQDLLIDTKLPNRKYVLCPRFKSSADSYLFVFDDNGTPDVISDDYSRGFTEMYDQDGKQIAFNKNMLRSIAQDKEGTVWVGTTEGVFCIKAKAKIFDEGFRCSRVKISRDDGSNLADYLLGTEQINCIFVDGGNRKWFGTENGAFLVSADGQETLEHFTTDNSPLISNSVISITANDQTGEVFFGTARGIISYQSDASEGYANMENVHAYPNPVRPSDPRTVTITGLVEESVVKICNVGGGVVYETRSNGGMATWDCSYAASGVYFAICFTADGKRKSTCKILVINE